MATRSAPLSGTVRPLVRALPAHVSPLSALAAVEHEPHTLFLESSGPIASEARWTLLAFDPAWRLEVRGGTLWRMEGGASSAISGHPMTALAQAWPERIEYEEEWVGLPFVSGLAGFLSYDLKDHLERYPGRARRESSLPDLSLGFYDVIFAWDRERGEGWAVSTGLSAPDAASREERARARLAAQWERVVAGGPVGPVTGAPHGPRAELRSNFTREEYLRIVERALEHIAAGDIYKVNLAQRFRLEQAPSASALFHALRAESPAPFSSLFTTPGGGIVSSSPERFFTIDGDRIETRPIKGTRPRGANAAEDRALAAALHASAKDRAENVMIVDLERNDLGRICEIGSVRVPSLCEVATYSNVHHLVSRVEGRLREDAGPVEVIRAMFPGGSITGAPKIRAIEIIDSLEPTRRGAYTGAIGYWDVSGACDFNITIRTIVVEDGGASFHVGGGIVADSTPEGEYEETLVKARGMMGALSALSEAGLTAPAPREHDRGRLRGPNTLEEPA
ncbi:MAG TPA: aminodeoxychorismate synthase component I [Candidatus Binatia bacterium]|nr:aminodeoxychorismate synthase component I [Candidatus Binatia bacterium]